MSGNLDGDEFPPIFVSDPAWDDMGAILDRLDVPYRHVREFSGSRDAILMLNCGADWEDHVAPVTVADFVEGGGVLFASDLECDVVASFTEAAFSPTDWDDEVAATVEHPELQDLLGRQEVVLDFDTAVREVTEVPPGAEPLLRAREDDSVLAYRSEHGDGKVVFTVFHNHSQTSEVEESLLRLLVMVPIAGSTGSSLTRTHARLARLQSDGDPADGADPDDPRRDPVGLLLEPATREVSVGEPLTVRVRDENGDRVRGATVRHPGGAATTGAAGACRVTFDEPGEKTLTVEKDDEDGRAFGTDEATVEVRASCA